MSFQFFILSLIFSYSIFANEKLETLYLKSESIIEEVAGTKVYKIKKGMLFYGKPVNPVDRKDFLIYDNLKKPSRFKVSSQFVSYIQDDIRLLPNEVGDKVYPPSDYLEQTSNHFLVYNSYNLYLDNLFTSALNQIYSDELESIIAPRYSFNFLVKPELPVYFGGQINFQSLNWKNDFENVRMNILSFGPSFKYQFLKEQDMQVFIGTNFEYCPVYSATTESTKDRFSAYIYGVELNSDFQTFFGTMTLSTSFRNHHLTLSKSSRTDLELTPNEFNLKSFGISIGYKTEWEL